MFVQDENGKRAIYTGADKQLTDPLFNEYILFYEYFDRESGKGVRRFTPNRMDRFDCQHDVGREQVKNI